jgi:hypothetical protein
VSSSSAKAITAFEITSPVNAAGVIGEGAKTIAVTVPYGTDVTGLTPAITHTGVSVSPASGATQNFSGPVNYTVTAADGSTVAYTVTVTAATSSAKAITAFTITSPVSVTGLINEGAKTIAVTVPYGTAVTSLTPAITHTGVSLSPPSGTPQNFTAPVSYTVTAADSSTATYTVTVSVAPPSSAKAITTFSITSPVSATGVINEGAKTITLTVPYGTAVTSLTPALTHTGVSISPASGAAENFTNPVSYTVTAEDGSTETYTVTVASSSAGIDISAITVAGLSALTFSGVPALPVGVSTSITITISGGVTVDGWYIDVIGPVTVTHYSAGFNAPAVPGFYVVNVIAAVGGVDYSGSFGLTVEELP